jgi:hypothetical protein
MIALASLCSKSTHEPKAICNDNEIWTLIDHLQENQAFVEGGFKDTIFKAAAGSMAHQLTAGPAKTTKMCKTKLNKVSMCTQKLHAYLGLIWYISVFLPKLVNFTTVETLSQLL